MKRHHAYAKRFGDIRLRLSFRCKGVGLLQFGRDFSRSMPLLFRHYGSCPVSRV
jgi:hypothetical protein